MSQPSDHTSDNADAKDDEKRSEGRSETTLLEDEEMPTFTSLSSPSRREDTDGESTIHQKGQQHDRTPVDEDQTRSPSASDDQGGGSIYVVSSGDETDQQAYDDEEEEDDYEDLDDAEEERRNMMMEEEEEDMDEEDEDDDPIRLHDVDTEDDYDVESERASDDFLLRRSRPLRNSYKARSLSLQDLTSCKSNTRILYPRKRYSLDMGEKNDTGYSQNYRAYPNMYKRPPVPVQYRHVESKVKQYIMNIREQNRRFMQKRAEEEEYLKSKNRLETNCSKRNSEEVKTSTLTTSAKDYVMKVIKELESEENDMESKTTYNTSHTLHNGRDGEQSINVSQQKFSQKDIPMEINYEDRENEKNTFHSNENFVKRNGSMESSMQDHVSVVPAEKHSKSANADSIQTSNGYDPTVNNLETRTLTYEEYMYSDPNSSQKEVNIIAQGNNQIDDSEIVNVEVDGNNAGYSLRIENVKSIQRDHIGSVENTDPLKSAAANDELDETTKKNMEIAMLRAQLDERNNQFNTLRDTYQKTLAENVKMKQELEDMRKALSKHEKEYQRPETKVAEVQTEPITDSTLNQEQQKLAENAINRTARKISRVASTSSTEQWTDSPCSVAISLKSPEVPVFTDSDSSFIGSKFTPRRTAGRPLSKAFITSSRILQTLSSITHGKSKPESPLVRGPGKPTRTDSTTTEREKDCNDSTDFASPIPSAGASNCKKRKAMDMLGASSFVQPFKIPHTSTEWRKKIVESRADGKEHLASNSQSSASTSDCRNNTKSSTSAEENFEQSEDADEPVDNVKCFVYREDENSKDRSFLIQAEESGKEITTDKSRIRECGPYLLGNVEVRMSEVNGTINIWGKEVSQDSTADEEDESESCKKSPQTKEYWENHEKFNGSQIVCSTSKKQKIPPRYETSAGECSNSTLLDSTKVSFTMEELEDNGDVYVAPCGVCGSPKPTKELRAFAGVSSSARACRQEERQCCCGSKQREKSRHENPCGCVKEKSSVAAHRRFSLRSPIDALRRSYKGGNDVEAGCKHRNPATRRSLPAFDEPCRHETKYNTFKQVSHACEHTLAPSPVHSGNCCGNHLSDKDEEDPLIPLEQRNETPGTRQRRLRGKRVRAILMDLLRGCGDCHNETTMNVTENMSEKSASCRRSCPPQIKISPCSPPSCSNQTEPNERCCCAYALSIESQLTEFRQEMEKVRLRSDAIIDMLNVLQSADMN